MPYRPDYGIRGLRAPRRRFVALKVILGVLVVIALVWALQTLLGGK